MNYGKILKEIRTYDLITQEEVAKKLGISKKTYGLYEIQIRTIPLKHLNVFCDYFNISIDFIFGFANDRKYENSQLNFNPEVLRLRIKEVRKENKYTQVMIGNFLNIDHSVWCRYEQGKTIIPTTFLYEFCNKFSVSADYLLGKIDSPKCLK